MARLLVRRDLYIILIFITASTATFHQLKPHKLYKTLVEPLFDVALKGIFSKTVIDPLGDFIINRRKRKHKKHHKYPVSHYDNDDDDEHYYQSHNNFIHEREIFLQHGGNPVQSGYQHILCPIVQPHQHINHLDTHLGYPVQVLNYGNEIDEHYHHFDHY
ncbi:hypothetical protein ABEB36_009475 [Hypothenemus hampei]|uniref:Uncharacterized protein n=1 Tax=Hypothenemus hampei TaxID=57062 RepID=A0ABD1EGZ5_HYPHA